MFINILIIKQSSLLHNNYIIMFYDFRSSKTKVTFLHDLACSEFSRPRRSPKKLIKKTEGTEASQ